MKMWVWIVVLLMAGCGAGNGADEPKPSLPKAPTPTPTPTPTPIPTQTPTSAETISCEDRVDGLERQLAALVGGPPQMIKPRRPLPRLTGGELIMEIGPGMDVDAAGDVILGEKALGQDRARLRDELAAHRERAKRYRQPPYTVAYVMADPSLPVTVLASVVAAIPAGLQPRLVVMPDEDPKQPPARLLASPGAKRLHDELAKEPGASSHTVAVANALKWSIAPCAPLVRAFGAAAGEESKDVMLARAVPEAMRECQCKMLDIDVVEYGVLAVFEAWTPRARWLRLPSVATLKAGNGTVAELARALARR